MDIVDPSAKNGFTRRSVSTPITCDVFTEPSRFPVMLPNCTPLVKRGSVTDFFFFSATVTARSRVARRSAVISSGQHFPQAEAKQVRSVAAVRMSCNVATRSRRAAGPSMARGTTVGESGPDGSVGVQVADAIAFIRALSLCSRELALEQL